eukprot:COSAG02_NODE_854_length_16499_cov_76.082561_16_plen_150_part_00
MVYLTKSQRDSRANTLANTRIPNAYVTCPRRLRLGRRSDNGHKALWPLSKACTGESVPVVRSSVHTTPAYPLATYRLRSSFELRAVLHQHRAGAKSDASHFAFCRTFRISHFAFRISPRTSHFAFRTAKPDTPHFAPRNRTLRDDQVSD